MTKEHRKKTKVKIYTNKQKTDKPEIEYIQELQAKYSENVDLSKIQTFKDFPLCAKTFKGLKDAGYKVPTKIQKETIMLALRGNDILGAAQTGSGKTLAFLIPMLEKLFCKQWTHLDGLGALIITPTRELALQIFETLKKIGVQHEFSCGLIIGGKDLKFERKRIGQCNIMICTPGRLLQHMDENPQFDANNLQILILDEADRCLDMGFKATMNAIIQNLPLQRQTFLFSATQTKSVKDLARLNLKDPSYVAVHEHSVHSTPDTLEQSYVVCELKDKIAVLWNFIRNHLNKKCIVFLSTCKQVKFVFEVFSKMRPGIPLMALHGRMHQLRRIKVYEDFWEKSAAVLFATDVMARGIDFPEVHWVIQVDCPEDAETYIHRVGRTARYHKGGESLLLLMPSELKMLEELEKKKIPIEKIEINPAKFQDPYGKMEHIVAANDELQQTARRAFVTYLKSIYMLRKKKDIFDVEALNYEDFAHSYGLNTTPRLRFLKGKEVKAVKMENPNKIVFDDDGNPVGQKTLKTEPQDEEEELVGLFKDEAGANKAPDSAFELFKVKAEKPTTKAAIAKKLLHEKAVANKKIKFDEEGNEVGNGEKTEKKEFYTTAGIDTEKYLSYLKEADDEDKKLLRERIKAKHKEQKRKLKEQKQQERDGEKVDDFGESESEDDVDLSWLPDPKKVYGDGNNEDVDQENEAESSEEDNDGDFEGDSQEECSDGESDEEDEEIHEEPKLSKNKRKLELEENEEKSVKKRKKDKAAAKVKALTSDLTVNEAEELALMLLQ